MASLLPLTAEHQLAETARFTGVHADRCLDDPASLPWLVTGGVLMAQQAATLALNAAGDMIPAQAGASEILLRAGHKDRLPAPYTLPFPAPARRGFDALVEARNRFMHPRAETWHIRGPILVDGLRVAARSVRHLLLTQPVVPDLISAADASPVSHALSAIEALAEFLED